MSSDSRNTVLMLLPTLSETELQEVANHVKALSQFDKQPVETDDWLLEGIMHQIAQRGLSDTIPPLFHIRKNSSFASYKTKSEQIRAWLERSIPRMNQGEKQALGRLCARCLARYINEYRQVSFFSLLTSVHLVPEAIDANFPDYARSGNLAFLVRRDPKN